MGNLCVLSLLLANIFGVAIFCLQPHRNFFTFFSHVLKPTFKFWVQYSVLIFPFSILFSLGQIQAAGSTEKLPIKKYVAFNFMPIFFASFWALAFMWAAQRFPIYEPEIVYFTITRPVAGGANGIAESLALEVLLPSLAAALALTAVLFAARKQCKYRYAINLGSRKLYRGGVKSLC